MQSRVCLTVGRMSVRLSYRLVKYGKKYLRIFSDSLKEHITLCNRHMQ